MPSCSKAGRSSPNTRSWPASSPLWCSWWRSPSASAPPNCTSASRSTPSGVAPPDLPRRPARRCSRRLPAPREVARRHAAATGRRQGPARRVPAFPAPGHAGARPRGPGRCGGCDGARSARFRAVQRRLAANRSRIRGTPLPAARPQHRRETCAAEPRTISRAAPPRTCLPRAPDVCTVRANPQNRSSSRVVRRRDLQPGHGVPRRAKQRGEVPNGTIDSQHAAGDPAACIESPATPADQNGRRPHKGRRSRQTAGNPAVRFDPQQPGLSKTGGAHEALQTFH